MATYKTQIIIQKADVKTDDWSNYYPTHSNINKTNGKEYFAASTNISNSTYNFKIRYCEKVKDIIFNTEIYRIVYDGRYYEIKNVDHYNENKSELTIVGETNGKAYIYR